MKCPSGGVLEGIFCPGDPSFFCFMQSEKGPDAIPLGALGRSGIKHLNSRPPPSAIIKVPGSMAFSGMGLGGMEVYATYIRA